MAEMVPAFLVGILCGAALMAFFLTVCESKKREEERTMCVDTPTGTLKIQEEKREVVTIFAGTTIPRGCGRLSSMIEEELMSGLGREAFRFADIRQREDKIMECNQIEAMLQIVVRDNYNPFCGKYEDVFPDRDTHKTKG